MRTAVATPPEVRKADADEPQKIIGYAVRWDQLSNPLWGFQEKFSRGAFTESLTKADAYAAWNHDPAEILGRAPTTLKLEEDEVGLRYEILAPSWASRYVETIERGDVRGSSFIFRPVQQEWDESNPDMAIRTILKAELYEVSPVTTPAYPTSSVGVRSAEAVYQEFQEQRNQSENKFELRQKQRERQLELLGRE
jgi:HK97 family phage prohead protease